MKYKYSLRRINNGEPINWLEWITIKGSNYNTLHYPIGTIVSKYIFSIEMHNEAQPIEIYKVTKD